MPLSRRILLRGIGAVAAGAVLSPSIVEDTVSAARGEPGRTSGASRPGGPIRLNRNENAYGPSAKAIATMLEAAQNVGNRYPDVESETLRNRIACFHGVTPNQVVLGCGSGEILRMAADAFLGFRKK